MMPTDRPQESVQLEAGRTAEPSPLQGPVPEPAAKLWTLRDLLLFVAFVPAALLAANLLVAAGYSLLKPAMGWRLVPEQLAGSPFFLLTFQAVFYGFVLGYMYLLVAIHHQQPFWNALGWRRPTAAQTLGCVVGGLLLAIAIRFAPAVLPDAESFPLERLFSSAAAGYAIGGFAILVAPLMEELIFRGLLFAIFARLVGIRFAVLTTAVLFAGLHIPEYWGAWNHILLLFLVGMVFSLARGLTGSLAPSVFLHVGYNASMMAGLFFSTQHFRALQTLLAL